MASKRALAALDRSQITADTPLRLDIAAALKFPDGSIGASSLRTEAARGRLVTWRVAGKDFTSLREIDHMMDRCIVRAAAVDTVAGRPPAASTRAEPTGPQDALAAALERAERLKKPSRNG